MRRGVQGHDQHVLLHVSAGQQWSAWAVAAAYSDGRRCREHRGPIHPRIKKPVGERLAAAAMGVVYGSSGAYAGPTISGCSVAAGSITVR